ncbi:MAG: hypothetical protein WCJ55_10595 [Chloroflexales bacterium]
MTTHEITIRIRLGPSAADQRDKVFEADTLIGDLITYCKKDFRLPEQDTSGEMIRYMLYREQSGAKAKLDKARSLRMLRVQSYEVLYLADERRTWWQGSAAPSGFRAQTGPGTEPLGGVRRPVSEVLPGPVAPPPPVSGPPRPIGSIPCSIELAPGCVRQVAETGQVINRDYLTDHRRGCLLYVSPAAARSCSRRGSLQGQLPGGAGAHPPPPPAA